MSEKRVVSSTSQTSYVQCPFFIAHGKREIVCEGLIDGCTCCRRFDRAEDKQFQKQTYCEKEYQRCEHYLSVMHWKWADEDTE